jgi:hypothetical protein
VWAVRGYIRRELPTLISGDDETLRFVPGMAGLTARDTLGDRSLATDRQRVAENGHLLLMSLCGTINAKGLFIGLVMHAICGQN